MYYEVLSRASPEFDVVVAVVDVRVRVVIFTCCIQHHAVTLPASLYRPLLCIERHPDDRSPRFQAILIRHVRGRNGWFLLLSWQHSFFVFSLRAELPPPLRHSLVIRDRSRPSAHVHRRPLSLLLSRVSVILLLAVIYVGWVPMMAIPTPSRSASRHL